MTELREPHKPRRLLKAAFDLWAEQDPEQSDASVSRWSKRLRYTRLGGDEHRNEGVTGEGRHFVQLAAAVIDVSFRAGATGEHRTQMLTMLLAGTSYDLDRNGSVSFDLDASIQVERLARTMAKDLGREVPGLTAYFRKVEDLALTHPLARPFHELQVFDQLSGFEDETFELNGWDGDGPSGHLVGKAVYDGFLLIQHEGTGFAATCPRVEIATLSYAQGLASVTVPADWSGSEEEAAAHLDVAGTQGAATLRQVWQEWRIFLVTLPGPDEEGPSFRIALVLERIRPGDRQPDLLSPFAPALWPTDAVDIIDLDAWETDPFVSLITASEGRLWLLGGAGAAGVLGLRASPAELLDIESAAQGLPELTIRPSIDVPAVWSELPVTTLAGMIDRNLKHVSGDKGLFAGLVRDAKVRLARLEAHEQGWRASHATVSERFEGDAG